MYVKSTVPVRDEDFDDQFDLNHQSKTHKRLALKIFRKNKEAFSKHACDLGCSTDIEMDIPLLTKEPHIQWQFEKRSSNHSGFQNSSGPTTNQDYGHPTNSMNSYNHWEQNSFPPV